MKGVSRSSRGPPRHGNPHRRRILAEGTGDGTRLRDHRERHARRAAGPARRRDRDHRWRCSRYSGRSRPPVVHSPPACAGDRTSQQVGWPMELVKSPRFGIVGKEICATVRMENQGGPAVASVRMTIRQNGEAVGTRNALPGTARAPAAAEDRPRGHEPLRDRDRDCAWRTHRAQQYHRAAHEGVRGGGSRVLLVSGEPPCGRTHMARPPKGWRTRASNIVHFTILRPPEKQDGAPTNCRSSPSQHASC